MVLRYYYCCFLILLATSHKLQLGSKMQANIFCAQLEISSLFSYFEWIWCILVVMKIFVVNIQLTQRKLHPAWVAVLCSYAKCFSFFLIVNGTFIKEGDEKLKEVFISITI